MAREWLQRLDPDRQANDDAIAEARTRYTLYTYGPVPARPQATRGEWYDHPVGWLWMAFVVVMAAGWLTMVAYAASPR